MKLEYFTDALAGRGLLLLYGDSSREARELCEALRPLVAARVRVSLDALVFVEPVDSCQLTAESVAESRGDSCSPSSPRFRWSLSPSEWEDTAGMLEPFCHATTAGTVHFQHLNPHGGPAVIYSTSRAW